MENYLYMSVEMRDLMNLWSNNNYFSVDFDQFRPGWLNHEISFNLSIYGYDQA